MSSTAWSAFRPLPGSETAGVEFHQHLFVRLPRRRYPRVAAVLFMALFASGASAADRADLERLVGWFGGEWNNHEQVWAQRGSVAPGTTLPADEAFNHVHHVFAPISMPQLGEHVFYVQQAPAEQLDRPYRQRIYRFSLDTSTDAVKLEVFALPDEATWRDAYKTPERFSGLDAAALKAFPGCEIYWRYDAAAAAYNGTMKAGACSLFSARLGKKLFITDTLRLTANEIWINDQARDESGQRVFGNKSDKPLKNRKVRYFEGWVVVNRRGKDGAAAEGAFSLRRDLLLHSEGSTVPIQLDDGSATPYDLQLAQLTYQRTGVPILKLAVLDRATGKSLAYGWSSIDASRIGLNLGWLQAGLTLKAQRAQFGFTAPNSDRGP